MASAPAKARGGSELTEGTRRKFIRTAGAGGIGAAAASIAAPAIAQSSSETKWPLAAS